MTTPRGSKMAPRRVHPSRTTDAEVHTTELLPSSTHKPGRKQTAMERQLAQSLAREQAAHIEAERRRGEAETARMEAETASQHLLQLQEVTDIALSHLALADLVPAVLDRICRVMAVDSAAILLLTEDGQELSVYSGQGALNEHVRIPMGRGIAGRIAASRSPLTIDDLSTMEVIQPGLRDRLRSVAGVPLIVEGRRIGVLLVGSAMPRQFTESHVRLLQLVSDRIALAIDHVQVYELAQAGYTEAEARASELAATFAAMTDGIFVADQQRGRVRSNQAFRQLLGLDPRPDADEIPPRERSALLDIRDVQGQPIPPEHMPAARILRGEVLQGPTALDLTMRALDGRVVEANVTGAPVRTTDGGIVGAVSVYRDVTKRRELERQVAEQASQLEGIFDAIADAVVVFDEHGRILRDNAADRRMFGFDSTASASPRSLDERGRWLHLRDEHGHCLLRKQWPAFRVLRGEDLRGSGAVELKARTLDGRELEVSESGAPIRDKVGRIVGGVLVVRDVTERRRLERRTREALQSLLGMAEVLVGPTGAAGTSTTPDTNAIIRRLTELTRSMLGCKRMSFTALDPETEHLKPVFRVGWPAEIDQQWTAQGGQFRLADFVPSVLIERLRAGEVVINDAANTAPLCWPVRGIGQVLLAPLRINSHLIGLLGLDYGEQPHLYTSEEHVLAGAVAQLGAAIIERERLVREREEAHASELASREATRRMELFMAMAAHEFRSPLTVIKGYLQLADQYLTNRLPDVEIPAPLTRVLMAARESLTQAHEAAMRMTGLLDDLLQVSRAQAGKLSMRPQPCDLINIVRNIIDEQQQTNPVRQVHLRLSARRRAPVIADPDRIGQVLTNYLTNAYKYSPGEQPVDVSVQVRKGTARVSVRDRGPGLIAADQEAIWDRFYQAPRTQRQIGSDAGLGLGLYVCKTIIEQHGGLVGVESSIGRGSTFWFTLPLSAVNSN